MGDYFQISKIALAAIALATASLAFAADGKGPGKKGGKKPAPQPPVKNFVVFDAMHYGEPDTSRFGMIPTPCFGYAGPKGNAATKKEFEAGKLPDKADFMRVVREHAEKIKTGPIVLDIEHIDLKGEPKVVHARIKLFVTLVQWAKEAAPGRKVGYWGQGGLGLYPENPAGKYQDDARAIAKAVDAFFPEMYVGDENREAFEKRMKAIVAGAHKLGKPVYPFLWPQFSGWRAPEDRRLKFVSGDFWQFQLQTAKACGADGVVLWGYYGRDKQYAWKEDAAWWQQTTKFMKTLPAAK